MTVDQRYIAEVVWLPTYLGVSLVVLATVDNSALATAVLVFALTTCHFLLEVLYRFAFGDARLDSRTKWLAFGSQLIVWGLVLAWHAQRTASST